MIHRNCNKNLLRIQMKLDIDLPYQYCEMYYSYQKHIYSTRLENRLTEVEDLAVRIDLSGGQVFLHPFYIKLYLNQNPDHLYLSQVIDLSETIRELFSNAVRQKRNGRYQAERSRSSKKSSLVFPNHRLNSTPLSQRRNRCERQC